MVAACGGRVQREVGIPDGGSGYSGHCDGEALCRSRDDLASALADNVGRALEEGGPRNWLTVEQRVVRGREREEVQVGVLIGKVPVAVGELACERQYFHGTLQDDVALGGQAGGEVECEGCERACTEVEVGSCQNRLGGFRLDVDGCLVGEVLEHRRPRGVPAGTRAGYLEGRRLVGLVGTSSAVEAGEVDK